MWVGTTSFSKDMLFISPEKVDPTTKPSSATRIVDGIVYLRSPSVWYSNLDHGRRHQSLPLMSMQDNIKFSKHKEIKGKEYQKYDNYNAIDVPFTDAIPTDYDGVMGVPISFLDKYCPEQFEIIWRGGDIEWAEKECNFFTPPSQDKATEYKKQDVTWRIQNPYLLTDGKVRTVYQRILIKSKQ